MQMLSPQGRLEGLKKPLHTGLGPGVYCRRPFRSQARKSPTSGADQGRGPSGFPCGAAMISPAVKRCCCGPRESSWGEDSLQ
jgi:hypothetical protein